MWPLNSRSHLGGAPPFPMWSRALLIAAWIRAMQGKSLCAVRCSALRPMSFNLAVTLIHPLIRTCRKIKDLPPTHKSSVGSQVCQDTSACNEGMTLWSPQLTDKDLNCLCTSLFLVHHWAWIDWLPWPGSEFKQRWVLSWGVGSVWGEGGTHCCTISSTFYKNTFRHTKVNCPISQSPQLISSSLPQCRNTHMRTHY